MQRTKVFISVIVSLAALLSSLSLSAESHGNFRDHQVFDATTTQWLSPLEFWHNYAESTGGLTWGVSKQYPNYFDVKEFDTLIIEVKQGPCLMEFFHNRWRRANDVRRWNPEFNEVLGCPHVFE